MIRARMLAQLALVSLLGGALAADPEAAPPAEGAGTESVAARAPVEVVDQRVWVGVGMTGAVGALSHHGSPGPGGGVGVEAGARIGKEARRSIALVARVHEALLSDPLRSVGNIEVQVQYPAGTGPHAIVGFTHNHEARTSDWLADPVAVTAGVHHSIAHRTGFEAGAGWDLAPPYRETAFLARFRPTFNLTAHVFPDTKGPMVYGVAELGLKFGLDGLIGG